LTTPTPYADSSAVHRRPHDRTAPTRTRLAPARLAAVAGALLLAAAPLWAQQLPDTTFRPVVPAPAYAAGAGPLVLVDEAHANRHSLTGTYLAFAELLRRDGYRVEPLRSRITRPALDRADILVIVNALADEDVDRWVLPTAPALAAAEIAALVAWVRGGGALLLVADHMPFPGATEDLAREFGIDFMNGFAIDTVRWDPLLFRRAAGTLAPHPITDGRHAAERVDSVATFWGQAFRATDARVRPLLVLDAGIVSLNPDEAWRFTPDTPVVDVGGWLQGAALRFGAGRVVVLGEAAMLTAQVTGPRRIPVGMNAAGADQNLQLVLNLMHWLSGLMPAGD
jgi:hypothetical protein